MKLLRVDGALFKDLNKNGVLDAYEDWRRPVDERASDLVAQMKLEEKAGLMVGPSLAMGPNGMPSEQPTYGVNPFSGGPVALVSPATTDALTKRHIVQFINRENRDPRTMATWLNAVQQLAEGRRLGTPVLFVTNPRNHYGAPATFGIAEAEQRLLAVAGDARPRGDEGRRPGGGVRLASPRRSTSRWGSAAPTTPRPTWRPSRGGGASGRRSGRTRS